MLKVTIIDVTDCKFMDNLSGNQGGGLYVYTTIKWTISSTDFLNNIAEQIGGAIFGINCTLIETVNSTFINNTASENIAGGVYVMESTHLFMTACYLYHNLGKEGGGGGKTFYVIYITITKSSFIGNQGDVGGGLYCSGAKEVQNFSIKIH